MVQPTCELCVVGDRFACVGDAKANQRRFKLIAQVSKELKHDALLARAASDKVVGFVDDDDTDLQLLQLRQRADLQFNERRGVTNVHAGAGL